jgi:ABC-2 type transport system permease protein
VNRRRTWAIARNDLLQILRSRDFLLPLMAMALLFFVILPAALIAIALRADDPELVDQVTGILGQLPASITARIPEDEPGARAAYAFAVFLFPPVGVIVPLTVASAVGATTMVGERERGTGEFLAHSPATETELYVGKLVASLLPGYATLFGGFALYSLMVNLLVGPHVGGWFFPTTEWWVLILWVMPPAMAVAIAAVLRVSGWVKSAAAAQQASSLVTLPVLAFAFMTANGAVSNGLGTTWTAGATAWVLATVGLVRGTRTLRRTRLLGVEVR